MDKFKSILKSYGPYVLVIVVVVLIRTFLVTPIIVQGTSMEPTLKEGNIMILNKVAKIDRYDIVVIKSDKNQEMHGRKVVHLFFLPAFQNYPHFFRHWQAKSTLVMRHQFDEGLRSVLRLKIEVWRCNRRLRTQSTSASNSQSVGPDSTSTLRDLNPNPSCPEP